MLRDYELMDVDLLVSFQKREKSPGLVTGALFSTDLKSGQSFNYFRFY